MYPFIKLVASYIDINNVAYFIPFSDPKDPSKKSRIYFKHAADKDHSWLGTNLTCDEIAERIRTCIQEHKGTKKSPAHTELDLDT